LVLLATHKRLDAGDANLRTAAKRDEQAIEAMIQVRKRATREAGGAG
jgi:hypothetical protein